MFRWITPENSPDLLPLPRKPRQDSRATKTIPWPLSGARAEKTGPDRALEVSALSDLGLSTQEIARYLGLALQEVARLQESDLDLGASLDNNMTPVYRTHAKDMRRVG
ncbi:hypothetical protein [Thioclava sp. F36-7]|uniref:hypothetical protein n=1 Tax=Thioclava sp. F36-7 TaxID=1915317 RepID=UPI0009970CA8|nr:hypothetical protein [Thioclava sp. F36-7]OOY07336.1 hypothetical protein BMI89_17815 [Thioclava sp. F36-7]